MPFPVSNLGLTLIALGVLLVIVVIFSLAKSKSSRTPLSPTPPTHTPPTATPPPTLTTPEPSAHQAHQLRAVIQEAARDLDQRSDRLESLILQAETKIAALESLLATAQSTSPFTSTSAAQNPRPHDPRSSHILSVQPPADQPAPLDPLSAQIIALSNQGLKPAEIAKTLNQHVGKVQLILALRR